MKTVSPTVERQVRTGRAAKGRAARGVARSAAIVCLAALAWAGTASAVAQRAVEVSPPVLLHPASAGASVDASFEVTNPTDAPIRVRVSLSDWHYQGDGTPRYLDAGTLPRSLAPFLTFNPGEMLLEPGQTSEVRYRVDLPAEVPPGTFWGVLFMEAEDPEPEPGFTLARFNVRVGHVVYVNVPPLHREGSITGIFGVPPSAPDGSYTLAIQYLNSGDTVQRLDGYVELHDAAGDVLFHEDLPPEVSLPGDAVGRTFEVFGPLAPGTYTALVVYDFGDDAVEVAADHVFTLEEALLEPSASQAAGEPPGDAEGATSAERDDDASQADGEER